MSFSWRAWRRQPHVFSEGRQTHIERTPRRSPTNEMTMPHIQRILETAIYVDDLPRAKRFYGEVLGLSPMFEDDRLTALDGGGGGVVRERSKARHVDVQCSLPTSVRSLDIVRFVN